jgi:5-methylcytosine-specific restriction endonuclease McrA
MSLTNEYIDEQKKRVKRLYKSKIHIGFSNANELANWYCEKLKDQDGKCKYCETDISIIKSLIDKKKLRGRKAGRGLRGKVLEVDKDNPIDGYKRNNCHLACYYCNNDKSYTLNADLYKHYFGKNRNKFFIDLYNQMLEMDD